jgi:hypothetical protein
VLAINPTNGVIYTAGATTSTDFPRTASGPVISSAFNGGETDGFIAMISGDGTTHIKSTYLGTGSTDMVYGVQLDRNQYPYVMGTTTGSWPVTANATFRQANGKQFISKLQPDLSAYIYSTVFGKGQADPDISPVAFLVDRCENVYVSGWGGKLNSELGWDNAGTTGLTVVNAGSLPTDNDGNAFYIFVLERDAKSQLFGALFGASNAMNTDHVDGGTSRFDANGVIYQAQCGFCNGGPSPFPTTAGSWSTTNRSSNCNLAMVKIAMELAGVSTGVKSFVPWASNMSGISAMAARNRPPSRQTYRTPTTISAPIR